MSCPACGREANTVIYMGFSMKLCSNSLCSMLWGFWSWLPCFWFNGYFFLYEGSYLKALWRLVKRRLLKRK